MRRMLGFLIAVALMLVPSAIAQAAAKSTQVSTKGPHGEIFTVSKSVLTSSTAVRVTGSRFDETVGIYLALCVIPKKGAAPTPCGGGINMEGESSASYWISSNPPAYGIGTAQEFLPGGRFSVVLRVSPMIGKSDCRKVRCAITTRADHTRVTDRGYDIFIPVKFK